MIIHDFRCVECGLVEERYVKQGVHSVSCGKCDGFSKKITLKAPNPDWTGLAMGDSASPEAIDKFEKRRKQQRDKEERCFNENGDYGPAPGSSGGNGYRG